MVPYIQSGLSSAFFEAGKELITKNKYDGTQYELYNPNSNKINVANLVDGGIFDNAGIISLLRRNKMNCLKYSEVWIYHRYMLTNP